MSVAPKVISNPEELQELINNHSIPEVARILGVSDFIVKQNMKRYEVKLPENFRSLRNRQRERPITDKEELEELVKEFGIEETAKKLGRKEYVVRRAIMDFGIEVPGMKSTNKPYRLIKDEAKLREIVSRDGIEKAAKYFGVGEVALKNNLIYYDIEITMEEHNAHIRASKKERYGDEYYSNIEQGVKTVTARYGGVGFASKELSEKAKKTSEERYGDRNYSNHEQARKTNLERYGVDCNFRNKELMAKCLMEKYGVDNSKYIHLPQETIEVLRSKEKFTQYIDANNLGNVREISEALKIADGTVYKYIRLYDLNVTFSPSSSREEDEVFAFIQSLGVRCEQGNRKILDGLELDIYCPDYKIGFEFDGNYWHSEAFKDPDYHQKKSLKAAEAGVFVFHIFEYEWATYPEGVKQQIKNVLFPPQLQEGAEYPISFHKLAENQFYNDMNFPEKFCYFLLYEFNPDSRTWETTLTHDNLSQYNFFAQKELLQDFIDNHLQSGETLVAYDDFAKSDGRALRECNFSYSGCLDPKYVLARNYYEVIRQANSNEEKAALENGYRRLYNCGQRVYTIKK